MPFRRWSTSVNGFVIRAGGLERWSRQVGQGPWPSASQREGGRHTEELVQPWPRLSSPACRTSGDGRRGGDRRAEGAFNDLVRGLRRGGPRVELKVAPGGYPAMRGTLDLARCADEGRQAADETSLTDRQGRCTRVRFAVGGVREAFVKEPPQVWASATPGRLSPGRPAIPRRCGPARFQEYRKAGAESRVSSPLFHHLLRWQRS